MRAGHGQRRRRGDAPRGAPLWPWLAGLFAVAFAVRATVAVQLSRTVLYSSPQLDHLEFLRWARSIVDGAPIWMPSHAPGYPWFLASLLAATDGSLLGARLLQSALGAGLCVLTALLGIRLFGRVAGLAAGAILALYGPLVFIETGFLAEGLFLVLLVTTLWLLSRPGSSWPVAAAAGLALGLATIVRATGLAFLPFALLLVLIDRRWRRRWTAAAALTLAWAVIVVPVGRDFGERFGGSFFLQGFGGLNVLMGNDPDGEGVPSARLGEGWDALSGEAIRAGYPEPARREGYYLRRTAGRLREEPLGVLAVLGKKVVWLLQAEEIRETHSYWFFRRASPVLRLLPGFGLLLPLAACGLVAALRRRPVALPPLVYLGVFTLTCVGVVVSSRYRLPLVPVLALYAGLALVSGWTAWRERRHGELALLGAVALLSVLVAHLWRHEPSHSFAEETALTASSLERDGDLERAAATYREALEIDPGSAYAWTGLGRVSLRRGDPARAAELFRTAIGHNGGYSRAHGGLGAALWMMGDLDGAREAYRRALDLSPDTPAIARDLGTLLVEQGRLAEGLEVFHGALAFDPNDRRSLLAVARVSGALERWEEGLSAAQRLVELEPASAEAWVVLSMLATSSGDLRRAEAALGAAERAAGAGDPTVRFGRILHLRLLGRDQEAERLLRGLLADHPDFDPARALSLGSGPGGPSADSERLQP